MRIVLIGNPDVVSDCLPLKLESEIRQAFPEAQIEKLDPNEEINPDNQTVIIDTVYGIKGVKLLADLEQFKAAPRATAHDFDLLVNLKLYQKIHPEFKVRIIGVPMGSDVEKIALQVISLLSTLF